MGALVHEGLPCANPTPFTVLPSPLSCAPPLPPSPRLPAWNPPSSSSWAAANFVPENSPLLLCLVPVPQPNICLFAFPYVSASYACLHGP